MVSKTMTFLVPQSQAVKDTILKLEQGSELLSTCLSWYRPALRKEGKDDMDAWSLDLQSMKGYNRYITSKQT